MMRMFLLVGAFLASVTLFGQTKPKSKAQVKTPPPIFSLKNSRDSFNYAMGLSLGKFYQQQGLTQVNSQQILKGLNDALKAGGKPLLSDAEMNNCISSFITNTKLEKAANAREEGKKWLEANAKNPGVIQLPSGVQYKILTAGSDTTHPLSTDTVTFNYRAMLTDGSVFDDSYARGEPLTLPVTGVIAGWTEALQLMTPGSKWMLYIPSNLAYGDEGAGNIIPPGATLMFEVELLSIKR